MTATTADTELGPMPEGLRVRYEEAMHAMQSGVLLEIMRGSAAHTPKHLRVGVNSALMETSLIVRLLVRKGLITRDEFYEGLAEIAAEEKRAYEQRLGVKLA